MVRIRGAKVLEPEVLFTSNIATAIKQEIAVLEKQYRDRKLHVETVAFEIRGDGKPLPLIKYSYVPDEP